MVAILVETIIQKKPESKIRNRSRDIDENNNVSPTMRNAGQAP